jgi:hypothetical protein
MSDLFAKVSGSIHRQVLQTCISQADAQQQKIRTFISKLINTPEFLVLHQPLLRLELLWRRKIRFKRVSLVIFFFGEVFGGAKPVRA